MFGVNAYGWPYFGQAYAPPLAVTVTLTDSAALLLNADLPTLVLEPGVSGIILLTSDTPSPTTFTIADGGKLSLTAGTPTVFPVQPTAGQVLLAAGIPTVYTFDVASGRFILAADTPTIWPLALLSARIRLASDGATMSPVAATSGAIILAADVPGFSHAFTTTLTGSGIILLKSDQPTVTPAGTPITSTGLHVLGVF